MNSFEAELERIRRDLKTVTEIERRKVDEFLLALAGLFGESAKLQAQFQKDDKEDLF